MEPQEFEITISAEGLVRVHMRGVKGKHCMDYTKWLASILGPVTSTEMTSEHYEPEGEVRLDLRQNGGRR